MDRACCFVFKGQLITNERASLLSCVGEPLKRSVGWLVHSLVGIIGLEVRE